MHLQPGVGLGVLLAKAKVVTDDMYVGRDAAQPRTRTLQGNTASYSPTTSPSKFSHCASPHQHRGPIFRRSPPPFPPRLRYAAVTAAVTTATAATAAAATTTAAATTVSSPHVVSSPLLPAAAAGRCRHCCYCRFYVAAKALAASLTPEEKAAGMCFPRVARIREISAQVATAVVGEAVSSGMAGEGVQSSPTPDWVLHQMYNPHYGPLISVKDYF